MSDERSWPELGEELARKSLELLESRVSAFDRKRITRRELWLVADALSDVTQGLVPKEAWEAIYAVRQSLKKTST